jgi:excisionase family DNA binding protein
MRYRRRKAMEDRKEAQYRNRIAFSVDEAAALLSFSCRTIRDCLREGQIAAARVGTRILVPRPALEALSGPLSSLPMEKSPATVHELARDMSISSRVIRDLIKAGSLPATRKGRSLFVDREEAVRFIASRTDTSGARVRPDIVDALIARNKARSSRGAL